MIRFEIDGRTYRIEWEHDAPDFESDYEVDWYGFTTCRIYEDVASTPSWEDQAQCLPCDRFVKETRRKISLTRAISTWERKDRAKVWAAYFGRKNQAKPQVVAPEASTGHIAHYI